MCVKLFTWDASAQSIENNLWVTITIIAIFIHGAGPGLSLWVGSGEAVGEGLGGVEGRLLTKASVKGVSERVEPEPPEGQAKVRRLREPVLDGQASSSVAMTVHSV